MCSQIVLKCFYLARIGRPDALWSVNYFARAFRNWNKACGKRLARWISYILFTTLSQSADLVFSRTLTVQVAWQTSN